MRNQSLRQKCYEKIKWSIQTLRFDMGQVLSEKDLATKLKIGRTPVREALQQLANEGFVVIIPRKGAYVSTVSLNDFQKIIESRIMLETYCARKAAELSSEENLADLRNLAEAMKLHMGAERFDEVLKIDRQIHMAIVRILNNQYIEQIANQVYDRVYRLWHLSLRDMVEPELTAFLSSHNEIVESLARRDPVVAERAAQRHIDHFIARIRTRIAA
jgi:GntR family transcriptional regulator, rspAB operon transcriptional repressor